tara:strand:- start:5745 stop:6431 length:687 start_codon:yes stop_codon:yes gene_type:complete
MFEIAKHLTHVQQRIAIAAKQAGRDPSDISLLAVSKTRPIDDIKEAIAAGQASFGENQVQDALEKIKTLNNADLTWHFIGVVQSNKTKDIANHFDWVHSIDREKIAARLHEQRASHLPPLNICLQLNVDDEKTKAGVSVEMLPQLAEQIQQYSRLTLRGLMAIPKPNKDTAAQRESFAKVREAFAQLKQQGFALDTLSMGMSNDLETAIAEGSTIVRVGTDIFGLRDT